MIQLQQTTDGLEKDGRSVLDGEHNVTEMGFSILAVFEFVCDPFNPSMRQRVFWPISKECCRTKSGS